MKVILLQDVAKIGHRFDIVNVPDGYAQNKLIPQRLAQPATPENEKRVKAMSEKTQQERAQGQSVFEEALKVLSDTQVTVTVEASEEGRMFKALKAAEIIEAAQKQSGAVIVENQMVIKTPIKSVGEHTVDLVSGETKGTLSLVVAAK